MKNFCLIVIVTVFFQLSAYVKETILMPMSDGIHLETDIYFPDDYAGKEYPVVLIRSPYDRNEKEEAGTNFTANNVVFVAQSFRGTFGSEGVHAVFHSEGWGTIKDGYDTLQWITEQPWSNGKIATIGGSAEGLAQYFMAGLDEKPGLVYQIISQASGDLHNGIFFPEGMFREHAITEWLKGQDASFFIDDLLDGDRYSATNSLWDDANIFLRKENLNTPVSHLAGWFDMFAKYQIDTFRLYQESGAEDQHLIIGPWDHDKFMTTHTGELIFPETSLKYYDGEYDPVYGMLFHFFFPSLATKPNWSPVSYYTIGDLSIPDAPGNEWKYSEAFPPQDAFSQILSATENLILKAGKCGEGYFTLTFDYSNPLPTLCGNNLTGSPGPCDVSQYRERKDIISFSTAPFNKPTEITGAIDFTASFNSTMKDFDIVVIITDIYPDGKEYLMLEGGKKMRFRDGLSDEKLLSPGEQTIVTFSVGYLSINLNKGHKLGVHVSPTYFPKYRIPSNVDDYWNNDKIKGEIVFDLSETFLNIDTIGIWGGEECVVEEEPDDDFDDETSDDGDVELYDNSDSDATLSTKSDGCSLLLL